MSKAQLKKELANMDAVQLRELILDLYSAKKEAKEYFEFFLEPDVNKLTEKVGLQIDKELNRTKRGMLCARFSVIFALLKDYQAHGVDAQHVYKLMLGVLRKAVTFERLYYTKNSFENGTLKLFSHTLEYADKQQMFDVALQDLQGVLDIASLHLKDSMLDIFESYKQKCK